MVAVMAAGMTPPLSLALATAVRKNLSTGVERENGRAAWLLGAPVHHRGRDPVRRGRPAAGDPGRSWPVPRSPACCRWPSARRCGPARGSSWSR
ncbi:hypothetical protein HBB16_19225 [Pseudonocardia sp. MCCB 268]|nr:hypothetical protein [Pseudonocardia cytotoxica]